MFSSQSWDGKGSKKGGGHDEEVETERTQRSIPDKEREVPREKERCALQSVRRPPFLFPVPDLERTRVLGGWWW